MNHFPDSPDQISPQHLTEYLRASGHLGDGHVSSAEYQIIGTGKMGDNARFALQYEGAADTSPSSLIAKLPAADEHARSMAGLQGAYYNEVMFYRDLAPGTHMRTPIIYGSEVSEDRTSFLLLMEDMTPAEPGSQMVGESREHTVLALREAAKLASDFYGSNDLSEMDHVVSAARDDGGAFGQALMEQYWPGFVDRFGHGITPECIAFGEKYVPNHAHFITRLDGAKTLIHGDFRCENILFNGSEATVVDWQTTGESSALTDAAYFLGGSVDLADRRDWEKGLIHEYSEQLAAQGVPLSSQECWEQYREYAMYGIIITVLGASFTTPDERSDKMFLAMIQRHLQQCVDLDSAEFLPQT